jgi:hypothetical protein
MAEPGVPPLLPSTTAALIAGVSPQTFRVRYLEAGLVDVALVSARGILVTTDSLERALDRGEISLKTWAFAERMRDKDREYQRAYRLSRTPAPAAEIPPPIKSVRPPTGRALRNLAGKDRGRAA